MPNLGDLLGQLMAEMTIARFRADVEVVRIAEMYSAHPLLKHFPVSRFRLPDIHIDLPVVYRAEAGATGEGVKAPTPQEMARKFSTAAVEYLRGKQVTMGQPVKRVLQERLDARAASLEPAVGVPLDARQAADLFARDTADALGLKDDARRQHVAALADLGRRTFISMTPAPARMEVGVSAQEIKDAGPDAVTRLQLKFTEEGLEWVATEGAEGTQDRLIVE